MAKEALDSLCIREELRSLLRDLRVDSVSSAVSNSLKVTLKTLEANDNSISLFIRGRLDGGPHLSRPSSSSASSFFLSAMNSASRERCTLVADIARLSQECATAHV